MAPNPRQPEPPRLILAAFTMSSNVTAQQSPPVSDKAAQETSPPPAAQETSSPPPASPTPPTTSSPPPSSPPPPPPTTSSPKPPPSAHDLFSFVNLLPTSSAAFYLIDAPLQPPVVIVTATTTKHSNSPVGTSSSAKPTGTPIDPSGKKGTSGGLDQKSKVAIGVVVPIAAIAILAILAVFFWKKSRARRAAEAERRKEVEDYAYNPNADPTIPAVGLAPDSYEMSHEGSAGYRGWGNTVAGSSGRKASTTMSGGVTNPYSDAPSPRGNLSEARSGDVLLDGSHSPEGEILGAMGPSAANNRGDVRRGPSNASSSYSAAGRSEGSDGGAGYGGNTPYYDQYGQNPYNGNGYSELTGDTPAPPVIRDNPARRNTRIENPAHFPQQSAGISQNF
ncbi:hypothetical protein PT974_00173 [Cladobotryum mycophilum]|uniref:Uncharacterized protein n=1 Tax=Cladobotryum mycophilum TaxID=491253 RepID=A0ABR0T021_9HYPO